MDTEKMRVSIRDAKTQSFRRHSHATVDGTTYRAPADDETIMSIALGVLTTLVLVACRPVAAQSPSCPCLQTASWPILGTDRITNASCNRVLVGGEVHCYPSTYGLGSCAKHDENREPHCDGSSPASYCAEPWCYVDPVTCRGSTKRFAESNHSHRRRVEGVLFLRHVRGRRQQVERPGGQQSPQRQDPQGGGRHPLLLPRPLHRGRGGRADKIRGELRPARISRLVPR